MLFLQLKLLFFTDDFLTSASYDTTIKVKLVFDDELSPNIVKVAVDPGNNSLFTIPNDKLRKYW